VIAMVDEKSAIHPTPEAMSIGQLEKGRLAGC
jgi:hypothetical protein